MSADCPYCDKELSEEKGEMAHGCLDCHYDPRVEKIWDLTEENERLKSVEQIIKQQRDRVITELVAEKEKVRVLTAAVENIGSSTQAYRVNTLMTGGNRANYIAREALKKIEEMK
jgi:hypothetical protein